MSQFIEDFRDKNPNGCIREMVETDIKSVKKSFNADDTIQYIDISSIDAVSHSIKETTTHIVKSAPSRAQQCVKYGDILVSTVRPINRNIAVVTNDAANLVASTGFCILRPKENFREYLLSVTTSDKYTETMCDKASGGLYPAVNNSDVLSYKVYIPDGGTLKKVSALYNQADKSEFDGFKSQFIEMFGDQNTNERCWEDSFIKELFSLSMGKTPARNRPDYWQQSSNKWISISDMAKYNRYTGDTDETISDIAVKETGIKKVPKGTIIMSFKLSIGRTAITSEDIYTNEAIMAFQDVDTNKFDISFLYYLIANKNWLYNAKQAVKGQTLNKESIGNSKIIVPPIALQKQFANFLNQADKSEYVGCYSITKPKAIC